MIYLKSNGDFQCHVNEHALESVEMKVCVTFLKLEIGSFSFEGKWILNFTKIIIYILSHYFKILVALYTPLYATKQN
jgi:hypothetical protein